MPVKVERRLKREARHKFPGDKEAQDRYVYGTMQKLGFLGKKDKEGDHEYR